MVNFLMGALFVLVILGFANVGHPAVGVVRDQKGNSVYYVRFLTAAHLLF